MTQEDKELLSKDLSARLPYRVKIETEYFTKATLIEIRKNISYGACKDLLVTYDISGEETPYQSEQRSSTIGKIKPYLFPLSSMTEEQKIIYGDLCYAVIHSLAWDMQAALNELVDWLNKNHFDYRGLIEKGLAVNATGLNIY